MKACRYYQEPCKGQGSLKLQLCSSECKGPVERKAARATPTGGYNVSAPMVSPRTKRKAARDAAAIKAAAAQPVPAPEPAGKCVTLEFTCHNESQVDKLIFFAKTLDCHVGIRREASNG